MIEIKCTAAEKERLMEIFDTKEAICPFTGLCTELPYYKTGMSHRECIEHNIFWVIKDVKPEEKSAPTPSREITITEEQLMKIAANIATDYYKPYMGAGNLQEFIMSSGFMALITHKLFKEEK